MSRAESAQLFQVDVQGFHEIADTVVRAVRFRDQLSNAGSDHDLALGGIEAHQVEMLQRFGELLLERRRQITADCDRIGRDRIGLPEKDQVAVLVMTALSRGLELFAVQFGGVDLVVVERFERRRVAAGIDRRNVLIRIKA